jgi:hypothetical protein
MFLLSALLSSPVAGVVYRTLTAMIRIRVVLTEAINGVPLGRAEDLVPLLVKLHDILNKLA